MWEVGHDDVGNVPVSEANGRPSEADVNHAREAYERTRFVEYVFTDGAINDCVTI